MDTVLFAALLPESGPETGRNITPPELQYSPPSGEERRGEAGGNPPAPLSPKQDSPSGPEGCCHPRPRIPEADPDTSAGSAVPKHCYRTRLPGGRRAWRNRRINRSRCLPTGRPCGPAPLGTEVPHRPPDCTAAHPPAGRKTSPPAACLPHRNGSASCRERTG